MRALPVGFIPTSPLGATFAPVCARHGVESVDGYLALRGVERMAFEMDWTAAAKRVVAETGGAASRRIAQVRQHILVRLGRIDEGQTVKEIAIVIRESVRLVQWHLQNLLSEGLVTREEGDGGEFTYRRNAHADADEMHRAIGGRTRQPRERVIASIRAFKVENGRLPTAHECNTPANREKLPSYTAVLKSLNVRNWQEAVSTLEGALAAA
jgi:DNA-binding transcriptional ArsR family regulator